MQLPWCMLCFCIYIFIFAGSIGWTLTASLIPLILCQNTLSADFLVHWINVHYNTLSSDFLVYWIYVHCNTLSADFLVHWVEEII